MKNKFPNSNFPALPCLAGRQSPVSFQSKKPQFATGKWRLSQGFTIIELMVSMGILMVLFALTTVNITRLPSATSQSAQLDILMSDIKHQQTLAMAGSTGGGIVSEIFGVHFEETTYTLFRGVSFSSTDPYNFTVELDPTLTFTNVTWPAGNIFFEKGSGDVIGYSENGDSFSITNSITGDVREVRLNRYGASY
jgi:type II secretory pathway pseudopilin PulG